MNYREFAKSGFKVSVVGMGTYYDAFWIASAMIFRVQRGRNEKLAALRAGLEKGINFIDSAEIYQSEEIVGCAIQGRKRDDLFIASKVWGNHLQANKLEKACRRSLSKLKTNYIDLYQIHFPSSRVAITETMGAIEKLVEDGLVRNIGVSNFSYRQMLEAESTLRKHELASTQMNYNLLHREVEKEILLHCEKEKIAMIPYYPLAHGKLARRSYSVIEEICKAHGSISYSQLALSWLFTRSQANFPIPRASKIAHVEDNAMAGDIILSPDEMKKLDSL